MCVFMLVNVGPLTLGICVYSWLFGPCKLGTFTVAQ